MNNFTVSEKNAEGRDLMQRDNIENIVIEDVSLVSSVSDDSVRFRVRMLRARLPPYSGLSLSESYHAPIPREILVPNRAKVYPTSSLDSVSTTSDFHSRNYDCSSHVATKNDDDDFKFKIRRSYAFDEDDNTNVFCVESKTNHKSQRINVKFEQNETEDRSFLMFRQFSPEPLSLEVMESDFSLVDWTNSADNVMLPSAPKCNMTNQVHSFDMDSISISLTFLARLVE